MKTTIDLPEDLLHQAKIAAAQRKTTIKELVIQGLKHSLSSPPLPASPEEKRQQRAKRILAALQASNTKPMVPLTRDEIYERSQFL